MTWDEMTFFDSHPAALPLYEKLRSSILAEVPEGVYFLNAAPLNLSGADGSPCRAILMDGER